MKITDLDKYCVIKWRLTDVCNYNCSYCIRRQLAHRNHELVSDFDRCLSACKDVTRISEELHTINSKLVKVDLIGGEISLFDRLYIIIEELFNQPYIQEINITTNLSRPKQYYIQLCKIAIAKHKVLSLTASYHSQFTKLDNFIDKCRAIHELLGDSFKCETVISKYNSDVSEFIAQCESIGCYYMCEEDLLDTTRRGQTIRNFKRDYRYLVTDDDGTEHYHYTRNEVLKSMGIDGKAIRTEGGRCTRDNNAIYLEIDRAIPCHTNIPISQFHVSLEPQICKHNMCTLCGHMSFESR